MATGGRGMYREADGGSTENLTMECAVCLDNCRRPVELPCYHTYCQTCLQSVAGSDPSFPCPSCRAPVILPQGGVLALPVKETMEENKKTGFNDTKPPDYNMLTNVPHTMTVKQLLLSTRKGRILIAVVLAMFLGFCVCVGVCLGTGKMKVDPCDRQMWECETEINSETVVTTALFQNFQDLPALQSQCRKMEGEVRRCVAEVQSACTLTSGINTTVSTWQSAVDSMCGPDVICDFQVHSCIPSSSAVDEINNATQRNPPDVKLVTEKCRALKERVGQCVDEVKADCSNVTSVSPTISSIQSTLNSLCGTAAVCNLEVQTCNPNSTAVTEINFAKQQSPPDVKLVTEKCRALTESVGQCVDEVKADCSSVTSVSSTISSIQSTFNSLCGTAAVCYLQARRCVPSNSAVTEINTAKEKMPPDVNLVTEKCRNLKASVAQCVGGVKDTCSKVTRASSMVTYIESTATNLCGTEALCRLKMVSCKVYFDGIEFLKGKDRIALLCRIKGKVNHCLYSEMDEECRSLPKINQDIDILTSTLASAQCSGGKRVMESFILILLMAAVSAWAAGPSL